MTTPNVHKAEPLDSSTTAQQPCAVCWQEVKRVPGGSGPTWVHVATGAVAGPGPYPKPEAADTTRD